MTKSSVSCGIGHITEQILNGKLHFLYSVSKLSQQYYHRSPQHKFIVLPPLIADTFDIFMLSKTKLDDTSSAAQFPIDGFFAPHRLDRNDKGGRILFYVRETLIVLPLRKYCLPPNIDTMFFLNKFKEQKWRFCYTYKFRKGAFRRNDQGYSNLF